MNERGKLEYKNVIKLGDSIELMKKAPENIADLVIADPPFGIGLSSKKSNYNRKGSLVAQHYNEISEKDYYSFTFRWLYEVKRLMKESATIYLFSGWNNLRHVLNALDEHGFKTINHIIWKYQFGVYTRKKYVTSHYHIIYAALNPKLVELNTYARFGKHDHDKNGGSLNYQDREDVWLIKRPYAPGEIKNATKLPRELIKKIILYSSKKGELVLDPFMGEGTVPLVSILKNRDYLAYEINPACFEIAKKKLKEMKDVINVSTP